MDSLEFYGHDLVEQRPTTGTFLFNRIDHLLLQSERGWKVYGLRHQDTKEIAAQIFIHISGKKAVSPLGAPFGSLERYQKISHQNVKELFERIKKELIQLGVKQLHIKNYPHVYDAKTTGLLHNCLEELDYNIAEEVSSVIPVDVKPLREKMAVAQRQKLGKSKKQFTFQQVELSKLKNVYDFINTSRIEKNQSLSMTYVQLQKVASRFREDFILFVAGEKEQIASAAIVIKVSRNILYTFYYAHDKQFDKISPVVFLLDGIYEYAQKNKFCCIDLGTSMLNGEINKPLLHFKKSIGGVSCSKFIFEKTFS